MHLRLPSSLMLSSLMIGLLLGALGQPGLAEDHPVNSARHTPIVAAVAQCRPSVVNLRGRKMVPVEEGDTSGKTMKQVNGMGTGVVIDSRGYVLTHYHVVEGVRTIEGTTSDRQKTTARLLAHDPETDLAILKIETRQPLPRIRIGTSSDLMLGEPAKLIKKLTDLLVN